MNRNIIYALGISAVLTGCANASGARMGLLSATAPVLAILQDDLFVGETVGYMDMTGTINVHSAVDPSVKCIGGFHYTGAHGGVAELKCNDGSVANLDFISVTNLSGYGFGRTSRGPASFTYGMTVDEAEQYLKLPEGKKLLKQPEGPRLQTL